MLELGVKSPVLIYDDADVNKAIMTAAMGIFVHSG
jgi:phenylacetaldehyde dehydrogenase